MIKLILRVYLLAAIGFFVGCKGSEIRSLRITKNYKPISGASVSILSSASGRLPMNPVITNQYGFAEIPKDILLDQYSFAVIDTGNSNGVKVVNWNMFKISNDNILQIDIAE